MQYFNDVWSLDHNSRKQTDAITGSITASGALGEGVYTYHDATTTTLKNTFGTNEPNGDLCIANIDVEIDITHDCVEDLTISLFGPGPRTGDVNYSPQSRGEKATLFNGGARKKNGLTICSKNIGKDDGDNSNSTTFSDNGITSISSDFAQAPFAGKFQPVESLNSRYGGERAKRASLLEEEHTRNELHEMATDGYIHY